MFSIKKKSLQEFYGLLKKIIDQDLSIRYPLEARYIKNGIGLKMFAHDEELSLYIYPDHVSSEFCIVRKGMRYIYPRRVLRLKKHRVDDLLKIFKNDVRLQNSGRLIEMYIQEIFKIEYRSVLEMEKSG